MMVVADGYCDRCANTGEIDCHCGGDLCVCGRDTLPCPKCKGRLDDDDDCDYGPDTPLSPEQPDKERQDV